MRKRERDICKMTGSIKITDYSGAGWPKPPTKLPFGRHELTFGRHDLIIPTIFGRYDILIGQLFFNTCAKNLQQRIIAWPKSRFLAKWARENSKLEISPWLGMQKNDDGKIIGLKCKACIEFEKEISDMNMFKIHVFMFFVHYNRMGYNDLEWAFHAHSRSF